MKELTVEQWAARAWAMRALIELHAERRFGRLAQTLQQLDPSSPLIRIFEAASREEATHAALCNRLAVQLGAEEVKPPEQTPSVAPSSLDERQRLTYEIVAACCIAETESMATLTLLLSKMQPGQYKEAVHLIARDEVDHAQAGWGHLAREAARGTLGFLPQQLVTMLDVPAVHELFALAPCPAADSESLYDYGVVPHTMKRSVFKDVVRDLISPGMSHHGVDPAPLQEWLTRLDTEP